MKTPALTAAIFAATALNAQDPYFLNQNQSLLLLNPSFAGSNGGFRDQFSYRNIWPQLSRNAIVWQNSFDAYVAPLKGGIGVSIGQETSVGNVIRNSVAAVTYARRIVVNGRLTVIPSFQVSCFRKVADASSLSFPGFVQWSPSPGTTTVVKTNADFAAGLLALVGNRVTVGASCFHLTQPDEGLLGASKLPMRVAVHGSYNVFSRENSLIQMTMRIQSQAHYNVVQLGLNGIFRKNLVAGIGWTSGDVVFASAGFRNEYFSILAGYDVTYSKLAGNTAGSWELHSGFYLRKKADRHTLTRFEKF